MGRFPRGNTSFPQILLGTVGYMGGLHFAIEADRQLTMLQADPARGQLYDRINDVVDAIEDDPGSRVMG